MLEFFLKMIIKKVCVYIWEVKYVNLLKIVKLFMIVFLKDGLSCFY